ncbi:hypothetical protein L1987_84201 [Smallanthus sonchifolius]|uniref:Uncharacterized protein n=1 Tax=Smallanthus sonchifolius TaxID=185202 RepID=A0ACB8YEN3_9ASTR|nr:hypothetical protein L1987_84201 [Smallanthus sonchifolius]
MLDWRLEFENVESKQEEEDKDIDVRLAKVDKTEFDITTANTSGFVTLLFSSTSDSMEQQNNIKEIAVALVNFTIVDGRHLLPLIVWLLGLQHLGNGLYSSTLYLGNQHEFRLNFGGDDPYSHHFPTFNGRDVYALCNNKGLDVFRDMTEDDYSWEVDVDKAPIIIVGGFGESVEVFKINESTEEWEKTDGLGKHMIYISNTSCICVEAKSPEMENKIYFPRLLHNEGTKIVFYSLETRKYHIQ